MRIRRETALIAFYALIAGLALYPVILNLKTHVPGDGISDYYHFHWSYWWIRNVLTSPDLNSIYTTDYIMFPAESNLSVHTLAPLWFPLWAALEPALGTVAAMNIIIIVSLILLGYWSFRLIHAEGAPLWFALWAGVVIELTPFMIHTVHWSVMSMLGWFWLPLNLLIWRRLDASQSGPRLWIWAAALGLALWAMGLTDLQYFLFLGVLLVPAGLWSLWRAPGWNARARLAAAGSLALTLATVLLYVVGPLQSLREFDVERLTPNALENAFSLEFPAGFFPGSDVHAVDPTTPTIIIPLLAIAILAGVRRFNTARMNRPRRWFWLTLTVLTLVTAGRRRYHLVRGRYPHPIPPDIRRLWRYLPLPSTLQPGLYHDHLDLCRAHIRPGPQKREHPLRSRTRPPHRHPCRRARPAPHRRTNAAANL